MWRSGFLQTSLLVVMASVAAAGTAAGVYSRGVAAREPLLGLPAQEVLLPAQKHALNPAAISEEDQKIALQEAGPTLRNDDNPDAAADDGVGDQLEKKPRTYRIRLTRDGLIPGRLNLLDPVTGDVRPMTNVTITMLQHGEVKATAKPGVGGVFQISGLKPGLYSLVGAGEDGYIAYGVQIMPFDDPAEPVPEAPVRAARLIRSQGAGISATPVSQIVEELLDIDSLAIPRRDFGAVLQLVRSYVPASLTNAHAGEIPEIAKPGADTDEALPEMNDPPSTCIKKHWVEIRPDGTLVGRMHRIHPETGKPTRIRRLNVFLVRDNTVVAQSPVNELGLFSFKGVSPGAYSFVAAGVEGFAAFSVRTFQSNPVVGNPNPEWIIPVGFMAQAETLWLDGVLLDASNVEQAINYLNSLANNNGAGGGGAGNFGNFLSSGGSGGSGGAGSGGGFGGIAAALAAAGAAVVATQNNGNEIISTSVTPVP